MDVSSSNIKIGFNVCCYNYYMNKYELTEQAVKQRELDKQIKDSIEINDDQYWSDRLIALNVELNELSNEIRFFKYWSKKPASSKEVILDEFVDCIHFSLSLANTLEIEEHIYIMDDMKRPISIIYFDITNKILELSKTKDQKLVKGLIFNLLEISWFMGYTMEDIKVAYDIKNKINYKRQEENY